MTRRLALDYGDVRIGVAISDPLGMIAQPQPFIKNTPECLDEILTLVTTLEVTEIIIGLPKHTKGGATKKSEEVDVFANTLKEKTSVPIKLIDERFSTQAARKQLTALGLNTKKQKSKIDSQSAAFVLQGYLDGL